MIADINLFIVRHGFTKTKSLSIINTLYQQNIIQNHVVVQILKFMNLILFVVIKPATAATAAPTTPTQIKTKITECTQT